MKKYTIQFKVEVWYETTIFSENDNVSNDVEKIRNCKYLKDIQEKFECYGLDDEYRDRKLGQDYPIINDGSSIYTENKQIVKLIGDNFIDRREG